MLLYMADKWHLDMECLHKLQIHTPVSVIETNFLNNDVTKEVPDSGCKRGQLVPSIYSSPHSQWVGYQVEDQTHNYAVKCASPESLLVLLPIYLNQFKASVVYSKQEISTGI